MKSLILLSLLAVSTNSLASSLDGCFNVYRDKLEYASFCMQGSQEEGVSGGFASMAFFDFEGVRMSLCTKSTGIELSPNKFVFYSKQGTVTLTNFDQTRMNSGDMQVGNSQLRFVRMSSGKEQRLLDLGYRNRCF